MPSMRRNWAKRSVIGSRGGGLSPTSSTPAGQLAAGQFQNQLAAAAAGPIDPLGIEPALEAVRRIAVQVQLAGRVADRQRVELGRSRSAARWSCRRLRCRRRPSRRRAPPARSASAITHIAGVERVRLVVDGLNVSPARAWRTMISPAGQLGQIEGVQRLAAFHQHVVGDVDHVVDRGDADRRQPIDQPRRGSARPSRRESRGPCSAGIAAGCRSRTCASSSTGVAPVARARPRAASARGPTAPTTSRAMPMCPRQSGRLLVTSRSIARSSPTGSVSSWFRPAIISRSANSAGVMSSVTYCFSQFQETSIGVHCRSDPVDQNWCKKPHVVACRTRECRSRRAAGRRPARRPGRRRSR